MKKYLLAGLILFSWSLSHAGQDRFGSMRGEIPRSSFTYSADPGVVVASNPTNSGGFFVVRYAYCSGVNASTITFYDTQTFTVNATTKDVLSHQPTSPTSFNGATETSIHFNTLYSSGIAYIKTGAAPCGIKWDYLGGNSVFFQNRP